MLQYSSAITTSGLLIFEPLDASFETVLLVGADGMRFAA
jgi:hypothetical protein